MEKYLILLAYIDKQSDLIEKFYKHVISLDLSIYENRYVFSLKTQQLYTAIEDLFKQIAKTFENNIEDLSSYHKELLTRLTLDIPEIRPAVISKRSFFTLDKFRAFRHFIRHAYDCELMEEELQQLQEKLVNEFDYIKKDIQNFKMYVVKLGT